MADDAAQPSFARDGERVAFAWPGPRQDNPDICVQQIGAGSSLRLTTDPGDDYSPVWSPDGRSIAFLRPQADSRLSELRLVPPLGGPERMLTEIRPQARMVSCRVPSRIKLPSRGWRPAGPRPETRCPDERDTGRHLSDEPRRPVSLRQ